MVMEPNLRSSFSSSEEDFINMEVQNAGAAATLFSYSLCHHRSSSAKEFEFQSFSSSSASASPADELFYMGKLLPLHLPPRLQILAQNDDHEFFSTPAANTPFESCNISPSASCHVSAELNPADYFLDYLSDLHDAKSRSKIGKKSSASEGGIGSKLNWRYIKSLFTKSAGCSSEYSAAAAVAAASSKVRSVPKPGKQSGGNGNFRSDTTPFGQIRYKKEINNNNHHNVSEENEFRRRGSKANHRRSFSGAFKRLSKPKNCSISSSSLVISSAPNLNYRQILMKSCSEMENPIQAAIAHCKRSQKSSMAANRDELGLFSVSAAMYGGCNERAGVCRG
ncbi:probable membrane-associated kinase regulator 4 [Andrographis paniculata]|uniref:probable membrane-associated kinase regulator 4 n=1 Tax=Andrographis paniculata TaxID=175694 RepID=UPI0021E87D78|nr:probable membrane-associated kinase regulator 4 [Andrographis paniculata]